MKKTIIKWIAGGVFMAILVLGLLITNQLFERNNIMDRIARWPDLDVETLEGVPVSTLEVIPADTPVLFAYFNTECLFCRSEITDIAEHPDLQKTTALVLISDESGETIEQFRDELGLEELAELIFLSDAQQEVREFYGIRVVPATYLYNREGELIQFYRGATKAEIFYKELQK